MNRHDANRRGFTLIELLVVMFILAVLFGLGAFFYPGLSARQKMVTATDRLSGMLLIAKQRAKRDGLVTGVRITTTGTTTELQYVQQPNTPSLGRVSGIAPNGPNISRLTITASVNPAGVGPLIEPEDYLELNGGGRLHRVLLVDVPSGGSTTSVLIDHPVTAIETYTAGPTPNLSNYRVVAAARPLQGEEVVKLPELTIANTTESVPAFPTLTNRVDVLFSPAGNVVGQTNDQGQVFLVIEDVDPDNKTPPKFIVSVRLRTGSIGVYPANPNGDMYLFARDGRSSGL